MIEIHPLRDVKLLKSLYEKANVSFSDSSMAVVASDGDEVLGLCLFELFKENGIVHHLEPIGDVLMADGILRSALHVMVENNVNVAFYSNSAPLELFKKLGFVKSEEKKQLDVEKLFKSCKNC